MRRVRWIGGRGDGTRSPRRRLLDRTRRQLRAMKATNTTADMPPIDVERKD